MKIDITSFGGIIPKIGKHLLPESNGTIAENCRLGSGMLRPLSNMRNDHIIQEGMVSMYRWKGLWLHYPDYRQYVPGLVYGENQRLYMSAEDGGLENWISDERGAVRVGCPEPTKKPTVYLSGSADTDVTKSSRVYVYTCVNELGEESAPSPVSSVIDWQGQTVSLSTLNTPSSTGYATITGKRIYRLAVGNESSGYLFVAEIAESETTYTDAVSDANLGEALPSNGWHVPDADLKGLVSIAGGAYAAYHGNEVRCSVPQYPYAWPNDYAYSVEYDIIGLASSGSALFIFTDGPVYYMSTDDLGSAAPIRMEGLYPCLSPRSIIQVTGGAVFASNDGLYFVGSGYSQPTRLTAEFYSPEEWIALNPSSMHGCYCNSELYMFYTRLDGVRGGIICAFGFDSNADSDIARNLSTTDINIDYATVVPNGEYMFVMFDGACWQWEGMTLSKMFATWQSRSFLLQNRTNFSACIVEQSIDDEGDDESILKYVALTKYLETHGYYLDGGYAKLPQSECAFGSDGAWSSVYEQVASANPDVVVYIYADNALVYTKRVASREPFALPSGFTARTWWLKVRSNRDIRRMAIAESMGELYE